MPSRGGKRFRPARLDPPERSCCSGAPGRVNGDGQGYIRLVIPDDTAGRPLTPGEQAAIADLERRLLLEAPAPLRERRAGRHPVRIRRARPVQTAGPLLVLLGTGFLLVAVLIAGGGGLLGAAAVLLSVVATAALWPLLPTGLGGPVRPRRRLYRTRGPVSRHR
jgi:hypothetical protein